MEMRSDVGLGQLLRGDSQPAVSCVSSDVSGGNALFQPSTQLMMTVIDKPDASRRERGHLWRRRTRASQRVVGEPRPEQ
jgi:hypothetical protein